MRGCPGVKAGDRGRLEPSRDRLAVFRASRTAPTALMRANRRRLESFVAADYVQAIKFLHLLGSTVTKPAPNGVAAGPFCRFHMGFDC
jgi:hypothetical protein